MISADYIMEKLAAQAPTPAAAQTPPPPPPPQAVAMLTVPAGPGEMPAPLKKYKDGPGDVKNALNSLNNLVYSLGRHMQGDPDALRQFQQLKMAGILKQADLVNDLTSWGKSRIQDATKAGERFIKEKALPYAEKHFPETAEWAKDTVARYKYGDYVADARKWLNKDSLGLGLKNWHVGAGLLGMGGLYGLYRMFSGSEEEKRRKQEADEMRKLRMELARLNLYRQYQ